MKVQGLNLPDSSRPEGLCPRCKKLCGFLLFNSIPVLINFDLCKGGWAEFLVKDSKEIKASNYKFIEQVSVFVCYNCKRGVVVIEEQVIDETTAGRIPYTGKYQGKHWWPLPDTELTLDIPIDIAEVFTEASMALMARCPRASLVMARRTLEAIVVDKGETKGDLFERLKNLKDKGSLHPDLWIWADKIRKIGNLGAHYDPINKVTSEEAEKVLSFVRELLKYLYEIPANIQRLQLK